MGTPDLLGTYGTFSFYTSDPFEMGGPVAGGTIYPVEVRDGVVRGTLEGPDNPLLKGVRKKSGPTSSRTSIPSQTYAKIVSGARSGCCAWASGATGCPCSSSSRGERSTPNAGST